MMESLEHELNLAGYDGVITTLAYPSSINTSLYAKSRHLYVLINYYLLVVKKLVSLRNFFFKF